MASTFVLDYLADPECASTKGNFCAEYRLLCSGTIHCDIRGGDWTKSEVARFLLSQPLLLYAASRPFEEWPLELVLRLKVAEVKETKALGGGGGTHTTIFYPDAEVAQDMAALLTVLCRRLITVSGKSSELHAHTPYHEFGHLPLPVVTSMRKVYWPPHPATVITSWNGQEIIDNNPPPLPVHPHVLTTLLLGLPKLAYGESIVMSARLYATAMQLIREQPDIAYQLLTASIETLANEVLRSFQPDDDAKVAHQEPVFKLVKDLGLEEEIARKVAITACSREHWATRKFKKFLTDNLDNSIWDEEDILYKIMPNMLPRREDFQKVLGDIYNARSKATHWGKQFPDSASYAGGPTIPVRTASALFDSVPVFPPVAWFERIVNKAIRTFWERSVGDLMPTSPITPE